MLKKLCIVALAAVKLCAFDLCLATYYPFIDDHRYVDLELYASADHHLQITKSEQAGRTRTLIQPLGSADRLDELQRMSGQTDYL